MIAKSKRSSKRVLATVYTLDIETDSRGEIVDIGFYDGETCRYFTTWEQFTYHLNNIDENALIYAHNGGGFDYVNYLMWLFKNGHKFSAMLKQSKIFCFYLEQFPGVKFVDSFCLFLTSLDDVSRSFSDLPKIDIDKSHYEDMRRFKQQNEKQYYNYLQRDCVALYQAVIKLRNLVNEVYELGNLPLSIGGVSMRLFHKNFLREKIIVPSKAEKDFTFRAYVGGRCEYLGFGKQINGWYENVNGYDFNSHYSSQMLKSSYPTRRGIYTQNFFRDKNGEIEAGVYEISFKQNHGRIPLLKDEFGDYTFEGSGVYTHHEINAILRNGGTVRLRGGYHYEETSNIFDSFVKFFFDEKAKAGILKDTARYEVYKRILNNLYGKFGQRDEVESLEVYSETEAREKMDSATINEFYRIDDEFCFYEVREEKKCYTAFPAIACMITARARMVLCEVLESCENPIYCDTDSIHCQDNLDASLVGDGLGQLKTEFLNMNARYGGKKSYEIQGDKFRQKGIPSGAVDSAFFDSLFTSGVIAVDFKRPLLLKSAIRQMDISPSKFQTFTRTIKREQSFAEKTLAP